MAVIKRSLKNLISRMYEKGQCVSNLFSDLCHARITYLYLEKSTPYLKCSDLGIKVTGFLQGVESDRAGRRSWRSTCRAAFAASCRGAESDRAGRRSWRSTCSAAFAAFCRGVESDRAGRITLDIADMLIRWLRNLRYFYGRKLTIYC